MCKDVREVHLDAGIRFNTCLTIPLTALLSSNVPVRIKLLLRFAKEYFQDPPPSLPSSHALSPST